MYDTSHPLVGALVKQVRVDNPEYQRFVGRQSKVVETFLDEKGNLHVHTEDGVWCPARLVEEVDSSPLNRTEEDEGPTSQSEDPKPGQDFEGGF